MSNKEDVKVLGDKCKEGFKLIVGRHEYRVICEVACYQIALAFVGNHQYNTNGAIKLKVFVDNKETDIGFIDPYAMEKIFDFIQNAINGQDSCWWNSRGKSRHDEKVYKEDEFNEVR